MIAWLMMTLAASVPANAIPCSPLACRHVGDIRVEKPDGTPFTVPIDRDMPWVAQDNLLLFPGEWILFRLIERDGTLVPERIDAGVGGGPPEPVPGQISVKVEAFSEGSLIVRLLSRHPTALDYKALVVVGADGPQRTSVCSLLPGAPSYETWRWPIHQIALWGFVPSREPGCKTLDAPEEEKPALPPARSAR